MPNTEPTHTSTEIINPVAAAFQHYIQQLHEQYPGIFIRFGTDADDPYFEIIKDTYYIDGRLFFDKFEVNKESFNFTHDPLSPQQIENILDPINTACINLGLSPFSDPEMINTLLSQCTALRQKVFNAVLADIPQPIKALNHLKNALNNEQNAEQDEYSALNKNTRRIIEKEMTYFTRLVHASLAPIQIATLRESARRYLQETSNTLSLPPHEHLSQALSHQKDTLQELTGFIAALTPRYTKEHIELLLDYRDKVNRAILTSDGINLLNGFFAYNRDNLKTPEHIQAQSRTKVAGAVLFKVTSEAEKTLQEPLSMPLKKFIAKVTNMASDNADLILSTLQNDYETSLKKQLSLDVLLKYLEAAEENKVRIQEYIECLPLKLRGIVNDDTFVAFHEHSFLVLFQTLLEECETLSAHPEKQLLCYAKVLDMMIAQFDNFKDHKAAIPLAIRLLNAMRFPERKHKHLRTNPEYKRHQDCLARCESQLSKEDFRKMLAEAKPMDRFEQLVRRVSQEVGHEAEQQTRRKERFNEHKIRSQSAFFSDNTQDSPDQHRRHAITRFKTSLKRPTSHDSDTAPSITNETKPSTSPRSSPLSSRKKQRSPEVARKPTPSATNDRSPPTPKHIPKKSRKKSDPAAPDAFHHYGVQPTILFAKPSQPENERENTLEVHEPSSHTLKPNGRSNRE